MTSTQAHTHTLTTHSTHSAAHAHINMLLYLANMCAVYTRTLTSHTRTQKRAPAHTLHSNNNNDNKMLATARRSKINKIHLLQ